MRTVVLASVAAAVLVAATLAFAAQIDGTERPDNLSGTAEDDLIASEQINRR